MPKQDRKYLQRRGKGGIWHYFRRVPIWAQPVEPQAIIEKTTKTADLKKAQGIRNRMNAAQEALWRSLLLEESENPREIYEAAIERARLEGFTYLSERDDGWTLEDLVSRIEKLQAGGRDPGRENALLGAHDAPRLTMSEARDRYFTLIPDRMRRYSPDQARKFRVRRSNSIDSFTAIMGDKPLEDYTRSDALDYYDHLNGRIERGEIKANAANKEIRHARQVRSTVSEKLELGLPEIFQKLYFEENDGTRRPAFTTQWILDNLLSPGALDGMKHQARVAVLALIETGLRPVELCNAFPKDIVLTSNIPYFHVREIDEENERRPRKMKTRYSERKIPLVGCSLEAMRELPDGFTDYIDRPSQLSDDVGLYFRDRQVLPSEHHSLYSLRHSFQERLNAAETIERLDCELMGHKFRREKYGEISLEQKRDHLLKIAVSV